MDAQCNETTPAIEFDRFHEDSEILTKWHQHITRHALETLPNEKLEHNQGHIWNQGHLKRLRKLRRLSFFLLENTRKDTFIRDLENINSTESNSGDVYIHNNWRWVQSNYSRDCIPSSSWILWHVHKHDAKLWPTQLPAQYKSWS